VLVEEVEDEHWADMRCRRRTHTLLKEESPILQEIGEEDDVTVIETCRTLRTKTPEGAPEREVQEKPDLEAKRQAWYNKYPELFGGVPPELPPMREINHRIPLIDEDKQYNYHLPRCLDTLKGELLEKIERYTTNGWWEECTVPQAAPLLSIPKKSGKLRTVVDCCKRNDNTVCDVTPFYDQDQIRMDIARAKYRSKIDLSDAYEQVRIEPKDVPKTVFAMPFGTMVSKVMQMAGLHNQFEYPSKDLNMHLFVALHLILPLMTHSPQTMHQPMQNLQGMATNWGV
jgi:hypothetical protein